MSLSVVLAEDDADLRFTYQYWFPDHWDVVTAENGIKALQAVDSATDVVVLDRMMPGKTGDQVLDDLDDRNGEWARVVVSAEPAGEQIDARNYDRYLRQPVTSDQLVAAVIAVLD